MGYYLPSTNAGIVLNNGTQNPATLASRGTVTNAGGDAIYGSAPTAWTITNLGSIAAIGSTGDGIDLRAGGTVSNAAGTAQISGHDNGVAISGAVGVVANSGTIASTGTVDAGVRLNVGGTVSNAVGGLIAAYAVGI
jgi:hypothetical protein